MLIIVEYTSCWPWPNIDPLQTFKRTKKYKTITFKCAALNHCYESKVYHCSYFTSITPTLCTIRLVAAGCLHVKTLNSTDENWPRLYWGVVTNETVTGTVSSTLCTQHQNIAIKRNLVRGNSVSFTSSQSYRNSVSTLNLRNSVSNSIRTKLLNVVCKTGFLEFM